MQIVINPKDNNQFASASLDRTIKVYKHIYQSLTFVIYYGLIYVGVTVFFCNLSLTQF